MKFFLSVSERQFQRTSDLGLIPCVRPQLFGIEGTVQFRNKKVQAETGCKISTLQSRAQGYGREKHEFSPEIQAGPGGLLVVQIETVFTDKGLFKSSVNSEINKTVQSSYRGVI